MLKQYLRPFSRENNMGDIIGFCNQKGGTGKTTTAINLAAFLAHVGKKVLVIDIDPQANATSGLGVEYRNIDKNVYSALVENSNIEACIVQTAFKNLSVVPSSINLTGAEIELISDNNREYRLKKIIDPIRTKFDFIIIDAPPSLGILTVNVLVAAQSVIIPIQCEYFALEGLSSIVNIIELIRNRLNSDIFIRGILFTMADFRTRLTMQVISEVKRVFPDKIFNTVIPRNIKLAEAPSFGKPIFSYDPECSGAKAYFNLAEEILQKKIEGVFDHGEKISLGQRS